MRKPRFMEALGVSVTAAEASAAQSAQGAADHRMPASISDVLYILKLIFFII